MLVQRARRGAGAVAGTTLALLSVLALSLTTVKPEGRARGGCFASGCGSCHTAGAEVLRIEDAHSEFCCGGTAAVPAIVMGTTLAGPPCMRLGTSSLNLRPGTCDKYGAGGACTCCSETATSLKKCLSPWAKQAFAEDCIGPTWQFTCCSGLSRSSFVEV